MLRVACFRTAGVSVALIVILLNMLVLFSDVQRDGSQRKRSRPQELVFFPSSPEETPVGVPAKIPTDYHIEEADFCRRRPEIEMIAYVHSVINQVEKRMNTRRTWASAATCGKGAKLGVIFVVGRAKTKGEEKIIRRESRLYHDIVQGNYVDEYHLLSYKALSSLYWIDKNCPSTPWTLHADDDILIDVFLLQEMIGTLVTQDRFICNGLNGPVRRTGKWAVTREEFPQEQYPLYCKGTMWLLPTRRLSDILQASRSANYLWVDDAFVTGVLAKEAGIGHNDINEEFGVNDFKEEEIGRNISWYHLPEDKRLGLWNGILEHHNCSHGITLLKGVISLQKVRDARDEISNITKSIMLNPFTESLVSRGYRVLK